MMDEKETVQGLVFDLVKAFVFRPNEVKITNSVSPGPNGGITILTLNVHPEDYGAVVGRNLRKIQALRIVTQLFGFHDRKEYRLLLPERERSRYIPAPYKPDPNWKPDTSMALLKRVLDKILRLPYGVMPIQTPEQTHFEISPHDGEYDFMERIAPQLHVIFHGIGKAQGHELYITMAAPQVRR